MYTTLFATAGDDATAFAVVAFQSGAQTLGEPEQPVLPAASKAYNFPSSDPMNTRPPATAGECRKPAVVAVHKGWHTCDALQFVAPVPSKALNLPLSFPTY